MVTFTYRPTQAVNSVWVSGSFNTWGNNANTAWVMAESGGTWTVTRTIEPGIHEYKFIINGTQWITDPGNPNVFGTNGNNVLAVQGCQSTPPDPPCGQVTFHFNTAPGLASSVWVSGTFNNWGSTAAAAWPMTDADGDGSWSVTRALSAGTYQYKLVVTVGSNVYWLLDPSNPNTGQLDSITNSLLNVGECNTLPWFSVLNHNGPSVNGTIQSTLRVMPTDATLNASTVAVTMDHQPVAAGQFTTSGNDITLNITNVTRGIHDVRVSAKDSTGQSIKPVLLKFHQDVSTDWRDALLYFAMTDRFFNGNPDNDEPVDNVDAFTNYQGGDHVGISQKIEEGYFDALGVNAIWISWPVDNPEGYMDGTRWSEHNCQGNFTGTVPAKYTAYHGYWPSNLDRLESRFGTITDLQDLVDTAHAHGIRILLDFTANHVHTSSPFYQDHVNDGYFNYATTGGDHLCEVVGWNNDPERCWFTSYLADLDYHNTAAGNAVIDYAFQLVRDSGADGFRFDAVKHLNLGFISLLRQRLHSEIELTGIDFLLMGETFDGNADLIKSFIGPTLVHGQFDFPLNLNVLKGLAKTDIGLDQMDAAARTIKSTYGNAIMSNFIGNHDLARFVSLAAGDMWCGVWAVKSDVAQAWLGPPAAPTDDIGYQRLRLAFTYIMTVPGIPLIYYGDEFGMPGAGDPDNRRMMRFEGALSPREGSTLDFMRQLGAVRAANPALRTGAWSNALVQETDVLAYARTLDTNKVVVALNRSMDSRTLAIPLTGLGISNGATFTNALVESPQPITVIDAKLTVTVPTRTAAIYVLQ